MQCILLIHIFFNIFLPIFISSCAGLFPLGSDVYIKCPVKNQSLSPTTFIKNNNVKTILYKEAIYVVISDFSQYNTESYFCPSNTGPMTEEIVTPFPTNSKREVTKFRVVGGNLVLFCPWAVGDTFKWKWTSLTGTPGAINVKNSIVFMSNNFKNRARNSNSVNSQDEISLFPTAFEDAGKFQLLNSAVSINLITIQVTAFPSTKVPLGSSVQLTCRVSHLLHNMQIELIWTKCQEHTSIHAQSQILNLTYMENNILIKNITIEDIRNWECLVFNRDYLVASALITLTYIKSPESDITENDRTPKTMFLTTPADTIDEDLPEAFQTGNILLIIFVSMILLTLIAFCIFRILQTLGGKNMEVQTNVPPSAEIQYASVRFHKRTTEFQNEAALRQIQNADSEVVYAVIQQKK